MKIKKHLVFRGILFVMCNNKCVRGLKYEKALF